MTAVVVHMALGAPYLEAGVAGGEQIEAAHPPQVHPGVHARLRLLVEHVVGHQRIRQRMTERLRPLARRHGRQIEQQHESPPTQLFPGVIVPEVQRPSAEQGRR